jgi:hypothetical protein
MWAYPYTEYVGKGPQHTSVWRAVLNSLNFSKSYSTPWQSRLINTLSGDFVWETYTSLRFFWHYIRGHPDTRATKNEISHGQVDFAQVFIEKDLARQVVPQANSGSKTRTF